MRTTILACLLVLFVGVACAAEGWEKKAVKSVCTSCEEQFLNPQDKFLMCMQCTFYTLCVDAASAETQAKRTEALRTFVYGARRWRDLTTNDEVIATLMSGYSLTMMENQALIREMR